MRKFFIIILIGCGVALGYWLARHNQKFFELPFSEQPLQQGTAEREWEVKTVKKGMDTWEVKEILGPPEKRIVVSEKPGTAREVWIYQGRRCDFENGILQNNE